MRKFLLLFLAVVCVQISAWAQTQYELYHEGEPTSTPSAGAKAIVGATLYKSVQDGKKWTQESYIEGHNYNVTSFTSDVLEDHKNDNNINANSYYKVPVKPMYYYQLAVQWKAVSYSETQNCNFISTDSWNEVTTWDEATLNQYHSTDGQTNECAKFAIEGEYDYYVVSVTTSYSPTFPDAPSTDLTDDQKSSATELTSPPSSGNVGSVNVYVEAPQYFYFKVPKYNYFKKIKSWSDPIETLPEGQSATNASWTVSELNSHIDDNPGYYAVPSDFEYYYVENKYKWGDQPENYNNGENRQLIATYANDIEMETPTGADQYCTVGGTTYTYNDGWHSDVVETNWDGDTGTLTIGTDETRSISEILSDEEVSNNDAVQKIVFADGSVWERKTNGGKLTATENKSEHTAALKDAGFMVSYYESGTLTVGAGDETTANLPTVVQALTASDATSVEFADGSVYDTATGKLTTTPIADATAYQEALEAAGFTVSSVETVSNYDVQVSIDDNGVVTITSTREGALEEMLNGTDLEATAYKEFINAAKGAGSKLVLSGPFKESDLTKLTQLNNQTEAVDMSAATFSNAADARFNYWSGSTLKIAYMSNDPKVTTITEQCFQNMNALEELHIGGSVTSIPANRVPNSIKKVYSSNSVTEIEDCAFLNHTNLELFDFGSDPRVERIGEDAFNKTALSGDLVIPNSVKRIETRAFKAVSGISSITIQEDSELEYIGSEAFRMDDNFNLKNVYVYAEKEIECDENAWDFYATDGQTQMATVRTRLHYPPSMYYWYVGDWKVNMNGGRIEGHEDLLALRNAVDAGTFTDDDGNTANVTPKGHIGWQKFISTGIPVTADTEWRTYSDIVHLKVPADAVNDEDKVADVYIVCGYEDGNAILKQMTPGDIIPAGTGLVIRHYVTDSQYGGLLMFPHVTAEEEANLSAEQKLPYRFVIDGDKRGEAGRSEWSADEWKDSPYVNIQTRDYTPTGETTSYHNYLEAIYTHGEKRAIYNAENGNYVDYNTLVMARKSGQKVTYRNFFFGNGKMLKESMQAGNITKGDDFNYETDGERGWGFFRCITDMYGISSKAFLHFPASVFTENHGGSTGATSGGTQIEAKEMGMFLIGYESLIVTDIKNVQEIKQLEDNSYYTLEGVRVLKPTKNGIYIHNGKKIVVK